MKYIFCLLLFMGVYTAQAQYLYNLFGLDTITDTEIDTVTWARAFTPNHNVSCHCEYVELSGTTALTQVLEGSQDNGTQWFVIATDTLVSGVNAAELTQFSGYLANNAARYRLRLTGAGTESLQYRCSLAVRRQ